MSCSLREGAQESTIGSRQPSGRQAAHPPQRRCAPSPLCPFLLLVLTSCRSVPTAPDGTPLDPPSYAQLAEAHNARIERLDRVSARGSIELRWTDQDGDHFLPGDVDLWMELPDRTAMNIEKFGERFLWIGSDGSSAWMFDFRDNPTSLHVAPAAEAAWVAAEGEPPIKPSAILALWGLRPLPAAGSHDPPVGYDRGLDAWIVTAPDPGGPVRLYLDRSTTLPIRAEILDAAGRVLLLGRLKLSRYERVSITGEAAGSGPRFPTLSDLEGEDVQIKLSLPSPADDGVEARFFDLDWLRSAFKPERGLSDP